MAIFFICQYYNPKSRQKIRQHRTTRSSPELRDIALMICAIACLIGKNRAVKPFFTEPAADSVLLRHDHADGILNV